ncbi:MAG TPA: L-threonylcarbamoyladenylate synthase [Candidatus Saccharimonadales bacterium]|nr:L-threonylcarbamoyladenylate synthase [Candidatus Saccharimonadales bacterium]
MLDEGSWRDTAARASEVLRKGGVALLPAEGVYGLHARAEDPAAVERLLSMKPRQGKKGWIGLIADPGDADRWAETGPRAAALIRKHWPGALTLVLPAKPALPAPMRNDDGTIALRCPGSDFLRAVVRNATGLVISTSANEPGAPPMLRPDGFPSEIVDLVVDQGPLSGTPSTVVRIQTDGVTVLREGAVRIDAS